MLFEFYWLRSRCLSPFTSQWAQRWPLCCLGASCVIGPNTIKCTFSIWGSKQWQPLRCPHAHRGPTLVTSSTWTMTLIYKQVTSATTAFTQGQLRSLHTQKSSKKQIELNHIVFPKSGDMTAHQQHKGEGSQLGLVKRNTNPANQEISTPFLLEKQIHTHHVHTRRHGLRWTIITGVGVDAVIF